jgi:hypothetical protein
MNVSTLPRLKLLHTAHISLQVSKWAVSGDVEGHRDRVKDNRASKLAGDNVAPEELRF